MDIQFIAGVAVVAADPPKSRELYLDALGLPLEADAGGDYFHTERIEGSRHFGVWPLEQASQACFGRDEWPEGTTVPQASIEFEVADPRAVEDAAAELEERGFGLLHGAREEPWGQTVARLLSAEGLIIGVSHVPQMHEGG
jgi:catechol 2,3-dioxygenase-like lactoylglutathione lyase family enzyme